MKARGFTLLEMLLVLVLIAGIGMVTTFALTGGFAGMQLRNTTKTIAAQLRYAHAQAIATATPQRFELDVHAHRWQGTAGQHGTIPEALAVDFTGARQAQTHDDAGAILFFPEGGSSGGRIELAAKDAHWHIDVAWLTGEVTLARVETTQ